MRVEMSSQAFRENDWEEKLKECRSQAEKYGWEFGVQLHNTTQEEQIWALAKSGIKLSAHAPLNQMRNWNLAAEDVEETFREIGENVLLLEKLKIDKSVFHGAYMSNGTPEAFGHGKTYFECMGPFFQKELSIDGKSFLNKDFTSVPEFARRMENLKGNLARLRKEFPSVTFALENDFPAFSSCNMFFTDMVKLGHPLCLDTGHLWIATHLADRSFHEEGEIAGKSGHLVMSHFHSSMWTSAFPKTAWRDGHLPLNAPNREMDLPRLAKTLKKHGLAHFVLEIGSGTKEDLVNLHSFLEEA